MANEDQLPAKADSVQELREFLSLNLRSETLHEYGLDDPSELDAVVDAWMNDRSNSADRYREMFDLAGAEPLGSSRILDMASGCGTFVFFGLLAGYDVWGLDCADWKLEFNHRKVDAYDYPEEWKDRFLTGRGEALPFPDSHFDFVSSFQTLEHVADVKQCLAELLRVTRPGGVIHIQCPDYRGSFEPHYRLPWLPRMPRFLASLYLRCCGRPTRGIEAIHYITPRMLAKHMRSLAPRRPDCRVELLDVNRVRFANAMAKRGIPAIPGIQALNMARRQIRSLFRSDLQVDVFVRLHAD